MQNTVPNQHLDHGDEGAPASSLEEIGLRAAWRYLRLAVHALTAPVVPQVTRLRTRLPAIGTAMQMYLLFNFILYGVIGLAFLLPSRAFHVGHTGLAIMDAALPHALWGWTALVVSCSQIAALISDRWRVWQLCAVMTAVWASALGVITLILAHNAGTYTGTILWFWLIGMHFLLISHQLVPHEEEHPTLEMLPDEDRSIVDAMRAFQQEQPSPKDVPPSTGLPFLALPATVPILALLLLSQLLPH